MTTGWHNDTCPCQVRLIKNAGVIELDDWVQKCFVHKDISDGELLSTLLTHNHQYDGEIDEPTRIALKEAEFIRIRDLGAVVKNV